MDTCENLLDEVSDFFHLRLAAEFMPLLDSSMRFSTDDFANF